MSYPLVSSKRLIRILDAALAVWVVLWLTLAVLIGIHMHNLTKLSRTLVASSQVLQETGVVLSSLRDVPVVGERVAPVEEEIAAAAASGLESGRASRTTIRVLSVLLGASIALIPTIPFLGLYLPLRMAWAREVESVRAALDDDDDLLEEFLARRATEKLSYQELKAVHDNPWRRLEQHDFRRLSRREIRRLGLTSSQGES